MDILKEYISTELIIKNSRFLNELFPCSEQSEARGIIKAQKQKYADATHVVHAFVLGLSGEVLGMSDDGEPSGTAGHPALDVLKGKNCTNVILTVTRWFGGTLLGTGGLVKAYSGGAKQVLEVAEEQNAFEPLVQKKSFKITLDYSLLKPIKIRMENYHFFDVEEIFDTQVHIQGQIKEDEYSSFTKEIFEFSNGRIIIE